MQVFKKESIINGLVDGEQEENSNAHTAPINTHFFLGGTKTYAPKVRQQVQELAQLGVRTCTTQIGNVMISYASAKFHNQKLSKVLSQRTLNRMVNEMADVSMVTTALAVAEMPQVQV